MSIEDWNEVYEEVRREMNEAIAREIIAESREERKFDDQADIELQ